MLVRHFLKLLSQNVFITSAAILLLGHVFGRLANQFKLPRVTGYILSGIVFGPSLIGLYTAESLVQLEFIPRIALGIIAVIIGAGLNFNLLRKTGLGLLLVTVFESLGAFILVLLALYFFSVPLGIVLPLAAIAAATAPAATVAVIKEYRARGRLTNATLAVVTMDDAVGIILFGLVMSLNIEHLTAFGRGALYSLGQSSWEIFLALLIGFTLGALAHFFIKSLHDITDSSIIILGAIFLAMSLAAVLRTSDLLANIFLGLTLINISPRNSEAISVLEKLTPPIYCFFFVVAGAHLDFKIFGRVGATLFVWSVVFIIARLLGKMSGAFAGATLANFPPTVRRYLGFTLMPEAGVAIGLALLIAQGSGYFEYRSIILNITLMAVAVNEIVGPVLSKYAFFKAKEAIIEE